MPTTLPMRVRLSGYGLRASGSRYSFVSVLPGARSLEPGARPVRSLNPRARQPGARSARPVRNARGFAIDRGEQVVDVISLEQQLAQRLQRDFAAVGVPRGHQLVEPALVLVALALDGLARS